MTHFTNIVVEQFNVGKNETESTRNAITKYETGKALESLGKILLSNLFEMLEKECEDEFEIRIATETIERDLYDTVIFSVQYKKI